MSGQSFPQDVVAGTQLVVPAIHSPNYLTGSTGWTINLDGSAEFNNLTIRGTFSGTNFIVNSSGAFFYSPTEAHGNLIVSIASAAGTDAFGNAYPKGINVTTGSISGTTITGTTITGSTISGTTFSGTDFITNASGSFYYSSTPAAGNLIASIASADGTDSFGNAYLAGVTSYVVSSNVFASNLLSGNVAFWAASTFSGPFTQFGNIGFSFAGSTGHVSIQSTDGISADFNGTDLVIPQSLSGSIQTLPPDNNSGTGWVSGERAFMNNNWVTPINDNFAAIVSALEAAGIAV
jgi:hypothetical protein